jgi:hypothetical protein
MDAGRKLRRRSDLNIPSELSEGSQLLAVKSVLVVVRMF